MPGVPDLAHQVAPFGPDAQTAGSTAVYETARHQFTDYQLELGVIATEA